MRHALEEGSAVFLPITFLAPIATCALQKERSQSWVKGRVGLATGLIPLSRLQVSKTKIRSGLHFLDFAPSVSAENT